MLKVLGDHHYQPTASSQDKDEARAGLEAVFDNLIRVLEQNRAEANIIEKSKTLRSMMFKLYKEARQSSRLLETRLNFDHMRFTFQHIFCSVPRSANT